VIALLARGLIREQIIDTPRKADAAMNTVWRNLNEPDGRGVLLYIAAGAEAFTRSANIDLYDYHRLPESKPRGRPVEDDLSDSAASMLLRRASAIRQSSAS